MNLAAKVGKSDNTMLWTAIRWLVFINIVLSFGGFNFWAGQGSRILDQAETQTYLIVAIWLLILGLSLVPGALRVRIRRQNLLWPTLCLIYVFISPLWSTSPPEGPKSAAFLLTALTVWRLTSILTVDEVLVLTERALTILCVASALVIVLAPSLGISNEWRPEVNGWEQLWRGVFGDKQLLGMAAGYFVFLTTMRFLHKRKIIYLPGIALGIVLTVGSGSRGGAVIAILTPTIIIAARAYPRLRPLVPSLLWACIGAAVLFVVNLMSSADAHIHLLGADIDFSNRTVIWDYAINLWMSYPMLGYGLDGFWRDPNIVWGFLRVHGWVLDNFHSGYLEILVETGLIGFMMFCILTWQLCSRLRTLLRSGTSETLELVLGLIVMTFVINLTETTFLRSTNYLQVLFNFLLVVVMSPVSQARGRRAAVMWAESAPRSVA
jgi:exopolysaccharide production protein ExoQ